MGGIKVVEYLSLDGVFEDPSWTQPYFGDEVAALQGASMRWADALLLGRVTYDGMSKAWPAMGNDPANGSDVMNAIGKYVPTSSTEAPTWNAQFLSGDAIAQIAAITDGGTNLLVYGSGTLVDSLREADLVDEFQLLVCPVVLGRGRRLFESAVESRYATTGVTATASGTVAITLGRA